MRRSDRQMNEKDAVDLLSKCEYGVLSTINNENQPYGIPLSYSFKKNLIYFHSAIEGSKIDNIINNDRVCFTVVGRTNLLAEKFSTEYESVVVFGRASFVEGEEKLLALMEIIEKYSPEFIREGKEYIERAQANTRVVKIDIESFTGKHRK